MSEGRIATIGMFDGVHLGHRRLLEQMKTLGRERGLKTLVVTFKRHPLALIASSREPDSLTTAGQRERLLRSEGIDDVVVLDFDHQLRKLTAREFMQRLRDEYGVRALVIGFNHRFGSDRFTDVEQYRQIGRELGIDVFVGDEHKDKTDTTPVSSSSIRTALEAGDVESAARMLGRPYRLSGTVVDGQKLGRKLGFPTANVCPSDDRLLVPAAGVYVAVVTLPDGQRHKAVVNIGHRPTVESGENRPISIEAYILDWTGDIYGEEISLEFLGRLRDEKRFESLENLKNQIEQDACKARAWKD